MKTFITSAALASALIPAFAFAQLSVGSSQDATALVKFIQAALSTITSLLMAGAVVYFLYGVFEFVKSGGDEEARAKGRQHMVAGVIGIAVMVSVWGLVAWVTNTAGTTGGGKAAPAPALPNII